MTFFFFFLNKVEQVCFIYFLMFKFENVLNLIIKYMVILKDKI